MENRLYMLDQGVLEDLGELQGWSLNRNGFCSCAPSITFSHIVLKRLV